MFTIESVNVDSVALPCFFLLIKIELPLILMENFSTPDVIRDLLSTRSMISIALSVFVRSGLMAMPESSASLFLLNKIEATIPFG